MNLRKIVGERIRRRRMALGWTQQELAKATGIPYPTLSRIEHGEQSVHYERVVKLADVLQVSTDYLLHRTDDPRPPRRRKRAAEDETEPAREAAPVG
jgi:transcriptional regulator with XRE-family HTH domain